MPHYTLTLSGRETIFCATLLLIIGAGIGYALSMDRRHTDLETFKRNCVLYDICVTPYADALSLQQREGQS
jgi:hypothetical protein